MRDLWELDTLKMQTAGNLPVKKLEISPVMAGISAMTMTALEGVNHKVLIFGGSSFPYVLSKSNGQHPPSPLQAPCCPMHTLQICPCSACIYQFQKRPHGAMLVSTQHQALHWLDNRQRALRKRFDFRPCTCMCRHPTSHGAQRNLRSLRVSQHAFSRGQSHERDGKLCRSTERPHGCVQLHYGSAVRRFHAQLSDKRSVYVYDKRREPCAGTWHFDCSGAWALEARVSRLGAYMNVSRHNMRYTVYSIHDLLAPKFVSMYGVNMACNRACEHACHFLVFLSRAHSRYGERRSSSANACEAHCHEISTTMQEGNSGWLQSFYVYVCMYVCIYICICICICMYICIYIHTRVHTRTHTGQARRDVDLDVRRLRQPPRFIRPLAPGPQDPVLGASPQLDSGRRARQHRACRVQGVVPGRPDLLDCPGARHSS
jgi:hypothetical protein